MKSNKRIRFYVICNCLIIGMFILFFANQSLATTYCVANNAELIAALDDAEDNGDNDQIRIQQGTYSGNFVYTSTESFGITIEGGYSDALCTLRDVAPDNTILDGEQNGTVLVLSAPDIAANFVVDGLTLQNGNVNINGGGLFVLTEGTVALTNNTIRDNIAENNGGGIYFNSQSGTLTFTNNIISNNSANGYGGGGVYFRNYSGTFTFANNTISDNSAQRAGGIFLYSFIGTLTFANNSINNNNANSTGGRNMSMKMRHSHQ